MSEPDRSSVQVLAGHLREQTLAAIAADTNTAGGRPRLEQIRLHVRAAADGVLRFDLVARRGPTDPDLLLQAQELAVRSLTELQGLQPLLADPEITNISIIGCDRVWVRYADGTKRQMPAVADSDADLVAMLRLLAAARDGGEERRFDHGVPRLSMQLPDGSRLFATMAVTERPTVSVRRHRLMHATLDDLIGTHTMTEPIALLLTAMVKARKNVLITGGTDTGKTTLLRAMAKAIPASEKIITIEDTYELGLDTDPDHPDCIAMQVREPNVEGSGSIDQAELVRWALRMSPDRVIVGEARGGEVVPLLNAMSQGTDGSLATVHASSSQIAFGRLLTYAAQSAERLDFDATAMLVGNALDFVVQLSKLPGDRRVVSSIRQVLHAQGRDVVSNEVYEPGPDKLARPAAPIRADMLDDLIAAGLDPAVLRPQDR
ncbi:CpaF family protein [Catellatospora paridis]|uniref:CpaF family protein n=1 Tax=Catellatospora paridis TaxID=1617086 RepID=UPI0012D48BC8|nr:ATPase, T2SS/T4P/T4SS family [Catellatospora paridis]